MYWIRLVNVNKVRHVTLVVEEFGANIVEVGLDRMNQELFDTCRKHGVKIMINHCKKEPEAFHQILRWGVNMVNVDHGDLFAQVMKESV